MAAAQAAHTLEPLHSGLFYFNTYTAKTKTVMYNALIRMRRLPSALCVEQ